MNYKTCILCFRQMKQEDSHNQKLEALACRGCRHPNHDTIYRRINIIGNDRVLHDLIMVDEYCISRWYKSHANSHEHSLIYREVVGVMKGIYSFNKIDPEPISLSDPVFKINSIINISTSNLDTFKHKLSTWITFS